MKRNALRKDKSKNGKFLEMLVECVQNLLTTEGQSVKRGQRFYSNGKQVGEVDVVIEGTYEGKFIKVGTECRDRDKIQGVDWIQQIIGRKVHLAEFGFTHWIAVSTSGFNREARELAKRTGIILLIPGIATPVNKNKHNKSHNWMNIPRINHPTCSLRIITVEIQPDDVKDKEILNELLKTDVLWLQSQVVINENEQISIWDFITSKATSYLEKMDPKIFTRDCEKKELIELSNVECFIDGMRFKLSNLKIEMHIQYEHLKSEFRTMVLAIPDTQKIIGFIGINEYKSKTEHSFLMIAVKPGDRFKPFSIFRDSKGNILPNKELTLLIPQRPPDDSSIIDIPLIVR